MGGLDERTRERAAKKGQVIYSLSVMGMYSEILFSSRRVDMRLPNSVKGTLIETKLTSVSVLSISLTK